MSGATELGDGRLVLILDVGRAEPAPARPDSGPCRRLMELPMETQETTAAGPSQTYILFSVAGTTYAVQSYQVRHMEMVEHVTPVPNAPPSVEGVVFSRGQVVPVINLRVRFGFERAQRDLRTRLLVVESGRPAGRPAGRRGARVRRDCRRGDPSAGSGDWRAERQLSRGCGDDWRADRADSEHHATWCEAVPTAAA